MKAMGFENQQTVVNASAREHRSCSSRPSGGALALMVNSEIGAVLAVMRRNVRWGIRYMADDDQIEHSLIQSFKELRKKIFSWQSQWHSINPVVYLQPFLDVIQSDETGAPITGVALSSVYKILTLEIFDLDTINVDDALHLIVDAVTSCRFEVTDPASEEVVLMKILQVLLACMKNKASLKLSNQHVCNIVNTCFRVVHQASSKGELLQRIARHTMHELIRCIFSHLPDIDNSTEANKEASVQNEDQVIPSKHENNGHADSNSSGVSSNISSDSMAEPYGLPCMIEIFQFLCSLLNIIEQQPIGIGPRSNPIAYDEDVPLFALGLINSAIELGGSSIAYHPKLLSLVQDELFCHLMQFGLSTSPLILSTVCSIVVNLYYHLRTNLKLQLEAFFSSVLLKIGQSKHGASYQQQEVAMETLVDLCRQQTFMAEMYANFDCDISCTNVFEDLVNLLSKSTFPVNNPLSATHILALEGLIALIQGMAGRNFGEIPAPLNWEDYEAFWTVKCESYDDPSKWVPFAHKMKFMKKKLMVGADHFNRDSKKGLEFLQGMHLLPDKLDPHSVACFLRYTTGLDKILVGDFLGNHDEFCIQVLHEFARTFDFLSLNLDTALRVFLETFKLPGESQKIQRVLEAFAERYYEQSPDILVNKDAALLLSYSLIMLNTDQHNAQVKKKMTEEDFIRNNRHINGGNDLPRDYLCELYHSICMNEIRMTPDTVGASFPAMISSHWIGLKHKAKQSAPFIICDSRENLEYDMFSILSGPTIAALSVVYDHVEQEDVLQTCVNGFLSVAKIAARYNLDYLLDDLVVSLCKFTTLLLPLSVEEAILTFGDDTKARMATVAVFTIANTYGDYIRGSWKNILDCILSLHRLGLVPTRLASDATDELEPDNDRTRSAAAPPPPSQKPSAPPASRRSSSLMGRFSQFLYLDTEEPAPEPSEEQLLAHQRSLQAVQNCHIDSIFTESKFLQAESLTQLAQALVLAAGRSQKSTENEDVSVFCLELLITVTLNNRDRIMLLWQGVYEHIASVVQSAVMPCTLVEKAVFGLLRICQRLLPYKENLTDELLKSLQLVLKLDARVADAYCENITHEVMRLVKANAMQIRSHAGWRTITSLLSITARHPEASEAGFQTLEFIMSDGAHLLPANYVLCLNAARQFAESRVGNIDQSVRSIDLMADSTACLVRWSSAAGEEADAAAKVRQDIGEMWLRLVQALRKVCIDPREEVRNHSILMLQRCLTGMDGIRIIPVDLWLQCFDLVIFALMDEMLRTAEDNSPKEYRNMETSLFLCLKLLSKVFLQSMEDLSQLTAFCKIWVGVLGFMEKYMKVKLRGRKSEKIHELVPELLKNTLLVMKTQGILVENDSIGGESFWQLTWLHVKNISPSLQLEIFPENEIDRSKASCGRLPETNMAVQASETTT
jgi:brefeldin A-resistance guanine nucleotide exchange factor 1